MPEQPLHLERIQRRALGRPFADTEDPEPQTAGAMIEPRQPLSRRVGGGGRVAGAERPEDIRLRQDEFQVQRQAQAEIGLDVHSSNARHQLERTQLAQSCHRPVRRVVVRLVVLAEEESFGHARHPAAGGVREHVHRAPDRLDQLRPYLYVDAPYPSLPVHARYSRRPLPPAPRADGLMQWRVHGRKHRSHFPDSSDA